MNSHILIVQTGKHKGKKIRLAEPEVLAGRDEEAKLRIASTDVSRQHCILSPQPDGSVIIRDLGSRNGTFLNGKPIHGEVVMEPGDSVTIGPMVLQLAGGTVKKRPPSTALPRKSRDDPKLSDDDITSWLSEEVPGIGASDTTIIPRSAAEHTGAVATPGPAAKPPAKPSAKKREYKSIAEEAQDIIRQHLESLEQPAS